MPNYTYLIVGGGMTASAAIAGAGEMQQGFHRHHRAEPLTGDDEAAVTDYSSPEHIVMRITRWQMK